MALHKACRTVLKLNVILPKACRTVLKHNVILPKACRTVRQSLGKTFSGFSELNRSITVRSGSDRLFLRVDLFLSRLVSEQTFEGVQLEEQKMFAVAHELRRRMSGILVLTLLLSGLSGTPGILAADDDTGALVLLSRERSARSIGVSIGEDLRFELAVDEGVRLEVRDNPYGIAEVFLYLDHGGFWIVGLDQHGKELVRAEKLYRDVVGTMDQMGAWPVITWMMWQPTETGLAIDFVISDDKARNREIRSKAFSKDSRMAFMAPVDNYFLPPDLTVDQKLVGLVHLWSEVKANFAFFDQVPELDWDQILVEYLPKIRQAESTYAYYSHLREMTALLKDGHTQVYGPDDLARFAPPVRLVGLAGRAIVRRVSPLEEVVDPSVRAELAAARLEPGEEVVRIDGQPILELLERKLYPRIVASTSQDRDRRAFPALLYGELGTTVRLEVKGLDQELRVVELTRSGRLPRAPRKGFLHREVAEGLAYVNLPGFGSDRTANQFDEVFPHILGASGLILDLRENGGGDSRVGDQIISRLIDRTIEGSAWKTRQYRPALRAWGEQETWYEGEPDQIEPRDETPFRGPIVVLVGAATFSAGEDFVVALHAAGRVTVVGRKTGGSTGQPLFIELPGGGRARICTKRDTYPDGREFVGVGIVPDIEVAPTVDEIVSGQDLVLERGVEVLQNMVASTERSL